MLPFLKMKIYLIIFFCSAYLFAGEDSIFIFEHSNQSKIPVYVSKPDVINNDTRLVVVMHGRKRNATTSHMFAILPVWGPCCFPPGVGQYVTYLPAPSVPLAPKI